MTTTQATYLRADAAIAAYDAFIFSSFGRTFDAAKADSLADTAVERCTEAARDRSVNQCTRDAYRALAAEFRAIL